jgi:hypothetical protein
VSHSIDETYDAYRETLRCAAKEHVCSACKELIAKGHRYYSVSWVFDGSADDCKRCLRCQAIHVHLREKAPGEMWPAERLNCGERYEDEWGECPDEVAALAFVSGADMQEAKP